MVKICPVSIKQINENLSRLNGLVTFLLSILFIITQSQLVLLVMVSDFILRNIFEGKLNPVTRLNLIIIEAAHIKRHMINAGPKIFAARVGLGLSVAALIVFFAGNSLLALSLVSVLAVFSFLESAFGYCVACKLYPYFLSLNRFFEKE